ncbi:MAG: hypothetical protein Q9166_000288 [cf. Caloplaca sp. 2 TL-2023]
MDGAASKIIKYQEHSRSYNIAKGSVDIEVEQFSRLVDLMYKKLPQELIDMIEHWTYEILFCPGFIYPRISKPSSLIKPPNMVESREFKGTARPALLCLSPQVYDKYHLRMLCENTWVIGTGPCTARFLYNLPSTANDSVQKLYLKLSIRDHGELYMHDLRSKEIESLQVDSNGTGALGGLEAYDFPGPPGNGKSLEEWLDWGDAQRTVLEDRKYWTDEVHKDLVHTWLWKTMDVLEYPSLTEFTLDFTECVGPEGGSLIPALSERLRVHSEPPFTDIFLKLVPDPTGRGKILTCRKRRGNDGDWSVVSYA